MKTEILLSGGLGQKRAAILEDNQIVEYIVENTNKQTIIGNIYKGIVKDILPGLSSAFIDIGIDRNVYLYISDVIIPPHLKNREITIDKVLKSGQEVLIQIVKEAIGTKSEKVSMDISLPSRYLVYMPFRKTIGISHNIENRTERQRLYKILQKNSPGGFIARTEAENIDEENIIRDIKFLLRLHEDIKRKFQSYKSPALLHSELGITFQLVRDMLSEDVVSLLIDEKKEYQEALQFADIIAPEYRDKIKLYEGKTTLFDAFNIEDKIKDIRKTTIQLPSGGSIIIQEMESICAIDVNTAHYVGETTQEDTATKTNLEACVEIARQLRLRNIGGIIVIDFIDMKRRENQRRVLDEIQRAFKDDRAKVKIYPITKLGLVELTRERKRESLLSQLYEKCNECDGTGRLISKETMFLKIKSILQNIQNYNPEIKARINLHNQIYKYFLDNIERLKSGINFNIEIFPDDKLSWEEYKIIFD